MRARLHWGRRGWTLPRGPRANQGGSATEPAHDPSRKRLRRFGDLAIITAQPGQRSAVPEQFRANVPAVLAEPGCIEYAPAIDAEGGPSIMAALGPDSFAVIEKWQDAAALEAHAAAPHMLAYGARVKDMLASRVIHVLSPA